MSLAFNYLVLIQPSASMGAENIDTLKKLESTRENWGEI